MTGFYFAQYHGPAMLQKTTTQNKSSCEGNPVLEVCSLISANEALEAAFHWRQSHTCSLRRRVI